MKEFSFDSEVEQNQEVDVDRNLAREEKKGSIKHKNNLVIWVMVLIPFWLINVLIILFCNDSCFHLSNSVLNTLLATTTLNIIGLAGIVLRGYFYK